MVTLMSAPGGFTEDTQYIDLWSSYRASLLVTCDNFNLCGSNTLKAATGEMVETAERDGTLPTPARAA